MSCQTKLHLEVTEEDYTVCLKLLEDDLKEKLSKGVPDDDD